MIQFRCWEDRGISSFLFIPAIREKIDNRAWEKGSTSRLGNEIFPRGGTGSKGVSSDHEYLHFSNLKLSKVENHRKGVTRVAYSQFAASSAKLRSCTQERCEFQIRNRISTVSKPFRAIETISSFAKVHFRFFLGYYP